MPNASSAAPANSTTDTAIQPTLDIEALVSIAPTINKETISHGAQEWWEIALNKATSTSTYTEIAVIILCIVVSYILGQLLRKRISWIPEEKSYQRRFTLTWLAARSGRLIAPVLLIITINTMLAVIPAIPETLLRLPVDNLPITKAVERVTWVWLLWVTLTSYAPNAMVRTLGRWILIPAAILRIAGWYDDVVRGMQHIGFSLGDINITLYMLVKGALIASVLVWVGRVAAQSGTSYIRTRHTLNLSTRELLVKLFEIVLYITLFITLLSLIGIDLTALAVFGGAIGVGLGFGLQKIAANFISGLILLTERSVEIGHLVEMDNGVSGYLRRLGARASIIETFDGREVMVPNEDFITSRVANLTYSSRLGRVEIPIGVSYSSNLEHVRTILLEAALSHERCLRDPAPQVFLREFAGSSVNFLLWFWVEDVTAGRYEPQSDVMFTIWNRFKEEGISIPLPQQEIHIRSGLDGLMSLAPETHAKK